MSTSRGRLDRSYVTIVVVLMLVLPGGSTVIELVHRGSAADAIAVVGKWFGFWAIGVRLLTAGVRQVLRPSFTAEAIFHVSSPECLPIVRELGFANFCLGTGAVVSLFAPSWRLGAVCVGGLYFAIAGIQHVIKKPAGPNEVVAMASDLLIAAIAAAYVVSATACAA